MQIETTVHKAGLLRLGYYLGGGAVSDQKLDRAARDSISEALSAIAGVQLVAGGGFALTPAIVGEQLVTLELDTEQIARAMHKLRDGQWPALTDAQLDAIEELTTEVGEWLEEAKALEAYRKIPKQMRAKLEKADEVGGG